jgi:hypothetical protein
MRYGWNFMRSHGGSLSISFWGLWLQYHQNLVIFYQTEPEMLWIVSLDEISWNFEHISSKMHQIWSILHEKSSNFADISSNFVEIWPIHSILGSYIVRSTNFSKNFTALIWSKKTTYTTILMNFKVVFDETRIPWDIGQPNLGCTAH